MADRYTYIPFIGLSVIISWGIPALVAAVKNYRAWIMATAVSFLFLLMLLTWIQVKYWENSIKLFEHTLKVTKTNLDAHINLGNALSGVNNGAIDLLIFLANKVNQQIEGSVKKPASSPKATDFARKISKITG